jgi:hypothetical protein
VNATNFYELIIDDKRAKPNYDTGAIVNFAKV